MIPTPEQLQFYAALAVLALLVIVVVALVIAVWWYYAERSREDALKTDLYERRVADRRRIIDRRQARSLDHE